MQVNACGCIALYLKALISRTVQNIRYAYKGPIYHRDPSNTLPGWLILWGLGLYKSLWHYSVPSCIPVTLSHSQCCACWDLTSGPPGNSDVHFKVGLVAGKARQRRHKQRKEPYILKCFHIGIWVPYMHTQYFARYDCILKCNHIEDVIRLSVNLELQREWCKDSNGWEAVGDAWPEQL